MQNTRSISVVRRVVRGWKHREQTVGFVPTMGALHAGHRSLVDRSRRLCDHTVVSVFVNPTQFGPGEDFGAYPHAWREDLEFCHSAGVGLVFAPTVREMYPEGFETKVNVGQIGDFWEGSIRPGHFDGVATIVLKLFSIVTPDVAVFGQKDFQQSVIVRRLIRDFDLPIRLLVAPTVRERDGLALSSRNVYLDSASRRAACGLYRALRNAKDDIRRGEVRPEQLLRRMAGIVEEGGAFSLDYAAFSDPHDLSSKSRAMPPLVIMIAATGQTDGPAKGKRFIDNILIR